jgi:hypothetical protein
MIAVAVQISDRSLGDFYIDTYDLRSSSTSLLVCISIMFASMVLQIILLIVVKNIHGKENRSTTLIDILHKLVYIAEVILIAILVSIISEITYSSSYNLLLVDLTIYVTCIMSALFLIILFYRFIKSAISHKRRGVIVYTTAVAALVLNSLLALIYLEMQLNGRPQTIEPYRDPWSSFYSASPEIITNSFTAITITSFIVTWIGTIMLLKHYSSNIGATRYWMIVTLPLVYALGSFSPYVLGTILQGQPFLFSLAYNFIVNSFQAAGGILFGFSFLVVSRRIRNQNLRNYLTLSGTGMMLTFSSMGFSVLILAPYPPFSVASVTFLSLASYFLVIGFDYSSRYIASDSIVRRIIHKSAGEFELLNALGESEVERSLTKKVDSVRKKVLDELETELPSPINAEDIFEHVRMVLRETGKDQLLTRQQRGNDDKKEPSSVS